MAAELLLPSVESHQTSTEDDLLSRVAAAAVAHPGVRRCRLWPVDRGVELRAEVLSTAGPPGMPAVRIGAGAALLNMRLVVAAAGHRPVTTVLPDGARPGVIAVLRRGEEIGPTPADRALYHAVPGAARQRPDVGPGPVPMPARHLLRRAAEAEGVWLRSVAPDARGRIAALLPSVDRSTTGLLLMLGGNHDLPSVQVQVGQAVQRVVLTAAVLGLVASVVAWPAELAAAGPLPVGPATAGHTLRPQVLVVVGRPPVLPDPAPEPPH